MSERQIPFVDPVVEAEELQEVQNVIKSKWLVEGKVARTLEKEFQEFTGTKFAMTTANGTVALHLAMEAVGINPGDEVITTPFTFIASANSISFVGGVPIFVDIDPQTWNIDPEKIKKAITPKTKAILPVHIFGLPANMPEILEIAEEHGLIVIEDAAQAHGARINGKHVGGFGDVGCFSFYATKNMIAGEGGMVVTNNDELRDKLDSLKNHGRPKQGGYSHLRIGFNYRTTDLCAAVALAQLRKLPSLLERREKNAEMLRATIDELEFLTYQQVPRGFQHANYVFAVKTRTKQEIDALIEFLREKNVLSRRIYSVLAYQQPAYRDISKWRWAKCVDYPDYTNISLPIAEEVAVTHAEVPIVPTLTREEIERVGEALQEWEKAKAR